ncbi:NUDIX hydrolase [Andreprevotia chitinilytica]|uniref:NUDIX hydrolase n=1 Tax=Andreprevotia chitinilytica TaxID=396808 RepID=UPI00068A7BA2|nr:DUF4743 domain-containing protein [Andreprevotia chitinilytica]
MDTLAAYLNKQPVFSPTSLQRLYVGDEALGWLEPDTATFLRTFSPYFIWTGRGIEVENRNAEAHLQAAALAMRDAGLIRGWRNELYAGFAPTGDGLLDLERPLFQLERAAFRRFGFTSRAVHINGYTADNQLWIGRRALSKSIDPDRLDNLAAGGLPAGEEIFECVIRELWEEAGVPAELAECAVETGAIRTTRNEADGTHDEIIYCFDLELPADFTPHNTDGEVAGFMAMTVDEVIERLPEFTWDAGAVTADFLRRKGWA